MLLATVFFPLGSNLEQEFGSLGLTAVSHFSAFVDLYA